MGLKQSIVVKNEFSCRTATGGTRGGSLDNYVLDYMSRNGGATEILTPVKLDDNQNYILNYMLRDEATESADSVSGLKQDFRDLQGLGGRAFGYGEVSLSDKRLREAAKDVQKNFKAGKTILKTVISFTDDYLKKTGIVRPDFECSLPGDYRGNIDQLKLRMAIMNGLSKVARGYDDLQYVGVIQVDTEHVHCHLAMFDKGEGTRMPDGTQRGKLTDRMMRDLRRGVDTYLDEKQTVKMMASSVNYDKQNTVGYIKRFTHETMNNRGLAQFMIACLPEDRSLWRAGSNASEMRKANGIVREYVEQVLSQPDSGFEDAMKAVRKYAGYRRNREDLTGQYYRELISSKQNEIITDSMNAVYAVLKQIPEDGLQTQTPLMDVMSLPYEDAADVIGAAISEPDTVAEFGFRLRSYKSRLDHHAAEFQKYHANRIAYEEQRSDPDERRRPVPESVAVYEFYLVEEQYNEMLMNKYQYFLDFIPPEETYRKDLDELTNYAGQITAWQHMIDDADMRRMSVDTAEQYGKRVHNLPDGHLMVVNPEALSDRVSDMRKHYAGMREVYSAKLAALGFELTEDDTLQRGRKYDFDAVKALDLHHMMYDFPYDFAIPQDQSRSFVGMADKRLAAFEKAAAYLKASGQEDMIKNLSGSDIQSQHILADRFRRTDAGFTTAREEALTKRHQSRTIRLDYDFYVHQEEDLKEDIKFIVKNTVSTLQYE